MSFSNYLLKQAKREAAYQQYNAASTKLELSYIYERLAEIESQHNPIAEKFPNLQADERKRLIDLVKYVVIGRFTEIKDTE